MDVTAILIAIALAPAAVAWWTGRRLIRLREDPALPELLLARQQRVMMVGWLAVVIMIFINDLTGLRGQALIFVTVLSPFIGGYQLRRQIHGDTIGFFRYLLEGIKTIVGSVGFWMLLLWSPLIIASLDEGNRIYGLALIPIMWALEYWYPQIWLRFHNAVPFDNATVGPHIERVIQRSGMAAAPPDLFIIGAPGQRFVNAVALRGRRPAIALGNAVMELLGPEEVAAIYAHELGHIEQIPPRELRRMQWTNRLLIVFSVAFPLLALGNVSRAVWGFLPLLWMVLVLAVFMKRLKKSQANETDSDLRAVALTGDAEVVARALVKIHVHGLIPRRWAIDFERRSTHPSLARRIQAVRGSAAQAPAPLGAPTVIATGRASRVVVFDEQRAYWFDGVPEGIAHDLPTLREQASGMRAASWQDLVELRISADSEEERTLTATHKNGDTWSVPIDRGNVAAVQQVLDRVDVRFRTQLTTRKSFMNPRLIAGTLLAGTFLLTPTVLLVPMLLVVWRPTTAALAAIGGVALVQAATGVLMGTGGLGFEIGLGAVVVIFAALALHGAWVRARRDGKRDGFNAALSVLGLLGLVMVGAVLAAVGRVSLREMASWTLLPTLAATLSGLCALMLIAGPPKWRWTSAPLGAGGWSVLAAALVGSGVLAESEFVRTDVTPIEMVRVPLGNAPVRGLALSPDGAHFLAQRYPDYRSGSRGREGYVLGSASGKRRELDDVVAAEFLGAGQLLAVRAAGDSFELRLERADTAVAEWTKPLPRLEDPSLNVSPSEGTWSVLGASGNDDDSWTLVSGTRGSSATRVTRFEKVEHEMGWAPRPTQDGAGMFVLQRPDSAQRLPRLLAMFGGYGRANGVAKVTATGSTQLGAIDALAGCGAPDRGLSVCASMNGRTLTVWLISNDSLRRIGSYRTAEYVVPIVGPGARVVAFGHNSGVVLFDAAGKRATKFLLPRDLLVRSASADGDRLGVVVMDSLGTSVVLYSIGSK